MDRIYKITENGFSMSDNKVSIPECEIKAAGFVDAHQKLEGFLKTKNLTDDIKLITPLERIDFDFWA